MKKDINSVKDVKVNELREYILSFKLEHKEEIEYCWSKKKLLKIVSYEKTIYKQAVRRLYNSKNYEEMEYHLIMMNVLFFDYEYKQIKQQLLSKLLERNIGVEEYLVIRHLINDLSFDYFIDQLYKMNTSLMSIVKICLIEDQYELAYQYLKQMDYCNDQNVLDLLCSYSPTLYCQLELHYYTKRKQKVLFQRLS